MSECGMKGINAACEALEWRRLREWEHRLVCEQALIEIMTVLREPDAVEKIKTILLRYDDRLKEL